MVQHCAPARGLEAEFIQAFGPCSQRKGIGYDAGERPASSLGSSRRQVSVAASRRGGGRASPGRTHILRATLVWMYRTPASSPQPGSTGNSEPPDHYRSVA